jgi:fructose-1,6-bisphosphatase I
VKAFASEERGEIIEVVKAEGEFGVVIDPLDGSSCIKTNLATGTIVGFFDEGNVLEKGNKMDAAMFLLYGPITTLVFTAKDGVHEFVLNLKGEFVLRKEFIEMPEGKIFGIGGKRVEWFSKHLKFVEELEKQGFKTRFSGAFVADFNQVLNYGGIFSYPATKSNPNGKLRLLFEANPMALIAEQAKGLATNGVKKILEIKPEKIEQRTPLYIGSTKTVELAEKFLKNSE